MEEANESKVCFKCHEEKMLGEFYKHKQMGDGHLNKCKSCTKRDVRRNRQESDRPREYDRERFQNNKERRAKVYESVVRRNKEHPEKYRARKAVSNAVRSGRLEKPDKCSRCKKKARKIAKFQPVSKVITVCAILLRVTTAFFSFPYSGINII